MLPPEIESRIDEIKAQVEQLGAELVGVRFRRAGKRGVLTVTADKAGGITLEDCAQIHNRLAAYVGQGSAPGLYDLEVESPGLDRPLETEDDFRRALHQTLRVISRAGVWVGELVGVDEAAIELKIAGRVELLRVPLGFVTKAAREISIKK